MKSITIQAYAKVNLSLDVKGLLDNGYHIVEMVMQQISLHDQVTMTWEPAPGEFTIHLTTSREDLPNDRGNLAYRAAEQMHASYPQSGGTLTIHIDKHIPVAAGMAGGSSNCAAVIHGINQLWSLNLGVAALCKEGARLGSDVPFCIMGQAAACEALSESLGDDPLACHCALATGTGTDLMPVPGLMAYMALSKPPIAVSTAEVYRGIDAMDIDKHPNNDQLIYALKEQQDLNVYKNMINVLENYTLNVYPNVMYTKDKMQELGPSGPVLMSGSGPTVYCICSSQEEADRISTAMAAINKESFSVITTR